MVAEHEMRFEAGRIRAVYEDGDREYYIVDGERVYVGEEVTEYYCAECGTTHDAAVPCRCEQE